VTESRFIVIGAGIMGLWSALLLREMGHDVLLLDAWEPGHSRSTSADENRVIRCGYGGSRFYADWAKRSQTIWLRRQAEWGVPLLHRCGVLWMVAGEEAYARRCLSDLQAISVPHARLGRRELAARFPQVDMRGIRWGLLEPEAGALSARRACLALFSAFVQAGGRFRIAQVEPPKVGTGSTRDGRLRKVRTAAGETFQAERFLFACGPWLPGIFPELLARRIRVTHKEVYYFGTPPGDDRFTGSRMPVWMELGESCYGVPSLEGRGFKVHPDLPGRRVNPTLLERRTSPRFLRMARECLARRFPDLEEAPVIETRVCQYECTEDDQMIFDAHPGYSDVWLVGGGSGHCFKHGPVIGEMAAAVLADGQSGRIPAPLRLDHIPRGRNF